MISKLLLFDSYQKWYVLCIQPNPRCAEDSPEGKEWINEALSALKVALTLFGVNNADFSLKVRPFHSA